MWYVARIAGRREGDRYEARPVLAYHTPTDVEKVVEVVRRRTVEQGRTGALEVRDRARRRAAELNAGGVRRARVLEQARQGGKV